jgi:hypothetical protein
MRSLLLLLLLLALAALFLPAAPLRAQAADTARVHAVLSAECPGARVRLYLVGDSLQGVCGAVLDGRLVVRTAGAERAVELASVREVWVRERQTQRGAIIGAGAGATLLTLAGAAVVAAFCETGDCGGDYANVIPLSVVVGGAGGALIGAGIGYLTMSWDRRYP